MPPYQFFMLKIAVFDSGFGSLLVINEIQRKMKSEIVYFADQKNFPYGGKPIPQLRKIILKTISFLQNTFEPDIVVVASNTPSLLLEKDLKKNPKIIRVLPPLKDATEISKSKEIAILTTKSVIQSSLIKNYIKRNTSENIKTKLIDASELIELVETGKFITNKKYCQRKIKLLLSDVFKTNIDVATLSSTHLPFLLPLFEQIFPHVIFLDPASKVAKTIQKLPNYKPLKHNKLRIFTSGHTKSFQAKLAKIGIKNKVNVLSVG